MKSQKIVPFLWFDGQAEAAANLYTSLFPHSRIGAISRFGNEGFEHHHQPEGQVMVAEMELGGFKMGALNGGPTFRITPAISFFVQLDTQAAVDELWSKLIEDGKVLMELGTYDWSPRYGWLNDRFGVSWQIAVKSGTAPAQIITPSLLFSGVQYGNAEQAMELYMSVFSNSSVDGIMRHDGSVAEKAGAIMHAQFALEGERFMIMDSAQHHDFGFNEGVSLMVSCETQDEVDHYWNALTANGGEESMCGWLKDRFGVSWQITPRILPRLVSGPDHAAASRVMSAMFEMRKLDIARLEAAAQG